MWNMLRRLMASLPSGGLATYPTLLGWAAHQSSARRELIQHLRRALTLARMCDDLKKSFYAACPVWYWPVLWWQFVIMERHLAHLFAARGRSEMVYGLSLGSRGRLRLIYLSDTKRHFSEGEGSLPEPLFALREWAPIHPEQDYPYTALVSIDDAASSLVQIPPQLYLDPG